MADPKKEINYRLRTAKHVERKMLCEAFQRLARFGALKSFRYVGFGAKYFVDFSLFHRLLGITKMISIERDTNGAERYKFNKPFKCIEMQMGESKNVLPKLPWKDKTILWLDYDVGLNADVLSDVSFFFSNAPSSSVFLITLNAQVDLSNSEQINEIRERLDLGSDFDVKALARFGYAKQLRTFIQNKIEETLVSRNGVLPKGKKIKYHPLFNFHYEDSVKMLTAGGIIVDSEGEKVMQEQPFGDLDFIRTGKDPYEIEVPNLTLRELRYLDTHLPIGNMPPRRITPIPDDERDKYQKIYRYFPTFAETDS